MSVKIETTTKITYPTVGDEVPVSYYKYDSFSCQLIDLFKAVNLREGTDEYDLEGIYDYLNNNGCWDSGFVEINDEDEQWLEAHPELHGAQWEVVVSVEIKTEDEFITLDKATVDRTWTVWVGGSEVNDDYLTKNEAERLAQFYLEQGHDDVVIEQQ